MNGQLKSAIGEAVWALRPFNHLNTPFSRYEWKIILKRLTQATYKLQVVLDPHQAAPIPIPFEIEFNIATWNDLPHHPLNPSCSKIQQELDESNINSQIKLLELRKV